MSDIAISKNKMMFITLDGEGFSGQWLGEYKKGMDKKGKTWNGTKFVLLTDMT